jgi:hypothetical protein
MTRVGNETKIARLACRNGGSFPFRMQLLRASAASSFCLRWSAALGDAGEQPALVS